jgi:ammonium transporter, Amt family
MKQIRKLVTWPSVLLIALLAIGALTAVWADDAPEAVAAATDAAAAAAPATPAWPDAITGNTIWLLVTGFLVFFMQAGFALVECGLTRAKNSVNIMMKNLLDFCFGALLFWAVGFAIMFGNDKAGGFFGWNGTMAFLGSFTPFGASGINGGAYSDYGFWFFQVVFAATAATIVSGAMAERTKLIGYVVYSILISAIIYPVTGHWIWGGGWLGAQNMRDFAGSTVVHSVGGWVALAGAIMVGPRLGKYTKDGKAIPIPGHNLPMACLGVFILWFGWYGFNPGSTLAANTGTAHIAVTTTLAAAAGTVAALIVSWIKFGKPDLTMALNGALAGLVGITAPCASVSTISAVIIGLVAGVLVFYSCLFFEKVLKVDDPVGAVSVHGVCGVWGTLAIGLFGERSIDIQFWSDTTAIQDGLFFGGGVHQLIIQLKGIIAAGLFAFIVGMIVFAIIKATIGLRVSDEEQVEGLDLGEHGQEAYPDFVVAQPSGIHAGGAPRGIGVTGAKTPVMH